MGKEMLEEGGKGRSNLSYLKDVREEFMESVEKVKNVLEVCIINEVTKCENYYFDSRACEEACEKKGAIKTPEDCIDCEYRYVNKGDSGSNQSRKYVLSDKGKDVVNFKYF